MYKKIKEYSILCFIVLLGSTIGFNINAITPNQEIYKESVTMTCEDQGCSDSEPACVEQSGYYSCEARPEDSTCTAWSCDIPDEN
ncbi:MAG: hypothetical protein ABJK11_01735 [Balneola sp.]